MGIFTQRYSLRQIANITVNECKRKSNFDEDLKKITKEVDTEGVNFLNKQIQDSIADDAIESTAEDIKYADWVNREVDYSINHEPSRVTLISTISSVIAHLGVNKMPKEILQFSPQKMLYTVYMETLVILGEKPFFNIPGLDEEPLQKNINTSQKRNDSTYEIHNNGTKTSSRWYKKPCNIILLAVFLVGLALLIYIPQKWGEWTISSTTTTREQINAMQVFIPECAESIKNTKPTITSKQATSYCTCLYNKGLEKHGLDVWTQIITNKPNQEASKQNANELEEFGIQCSETIK